MVQVHCSHTKMMSVADIVENPRNPNTHPERQLELLAKIIANQGWRNPITVSKRSGFIVKGHGRYQAALKLGLEEVPVDLQHYESEAMEWADMVADNRIAELAEIQRSSLKDLLLDLDATNIDLDLSGFEEGEIADLMTEFADLFEGETDPDEVPEPPEEPVTKKGDIWLLGEHRLMCGDSSSIEDVTRVMNGRLADMVLTDPPYGVAYVGKTKDALTIQSDDVTEDQLDVMCKQWFDNCQEVSRKGAYWVATVPAGPLHGVFFNDWKSRGILRQVMVWVKDSMVLGHSEYHYRHEPILFGWLPDGDRLKNKDRKKTTVWEFDRPKRSLEHPTMKPVEMWTYAINQHTRVGDLVYEPFSGSGTTHVASERTGRICYGLEVDPVYCDVIVNRWEKFSGKKAELTNG